MIYARSTNGEIVEAEPGGEGYCPNCKSHLIPKCGEINAWHWAHRAGDCDPWYEPETAWHVGWKRRVRPERCEVTMGCHRADILGNFDTVFEFQYSPIDTWDARAREEHYGKMIWVFYAWDFADRVHFRDRGNHHTFRWKYPRKTQALLNCPIFWDFCNGSMFHVRKVHEGVPCGGWGTFIPRDVFIKRYLSSALTEDEALRIGR